MVLSPPAFWFQESPSLTARLLAPLEAVWRGMAARRQRRTKPYNVDIPVICIGNVTLGGAGKTPVALDLAAEIRAAGNTVHFLSRGYGGRLKGPVAVDVIRHTAEHVGDEPLLLAQTAPTWVSADRVAGAEAARTAGADHIVMDDGFQNPSLEKSASILVLDGGVGVGNGRVFPAGPLREAFEDALARASVIAVLGDETAPLPSFDDRPVARARLVGALPEGLPPGTPCLAFAGIGRPTKFFDTVRSCGLDLRATRAFSDHHAFSPVELESLTRKADQDGLTLVTTAKDHVRLPTALRDRVHKVELRLDWVDGVSPFSLLFGEGHNVV